MKASVGALGSLSIFSLVIVALFHHGEGGKTLKLPHYEVTFGSWPLMEVKKTGSLRPSFGSRIRGGRNNNIINPIGPKPGGFRLGPPPTPAKLLLVNPSVQKGNLHKHLQETLKHYASNNKPLNLPLPIIVKAPGPHPPPPPPGYKLGPPTGPNPDSSWRPGAPYTVNDVTSQQAGPRSSKLLSMLKNAAYSGIFRNSVDGYFVSPEFSHGPPMSGTFINILPDGTQIRTHVNGDVIPGTGSHDPSVETKPSVAPVLKIGGDVPENYTLLYAQRQIIGLKTPDFSEKSGVENPGASEYEAAVNLGTKYEQGYGAKPPPTHPLVITTFQKRGDIHHHHIPDKIVEQELPDTGLISTTNVVFQSPNISVPIGGRNSPLFKAALEDKQKILKTRRKEKPLDAQVKLLGRLFTKLQRLKPPMLRVPADENEEFDPKKEPGGWNSDDDDGWKKVAKTKVDSPIMAVSIQTYSAPEVDSSDPDVVESMAEFGSHDVEFEESDAVVNLMEGLMKYGSSRVDLRDLGSNPEEINDNLLSWVRKHLALARDVNKQAHERGEEIANNNFKQYQTFVTPPFANNGWGPGDALPMDPKTARRSFSNTMTQNIASMRKTEAAPNK